MAAVHLFGTVVLVAIGKTWGDCNSGCVSCKLNTKSELTRATSTLVVIELSGGQVHGITTPPRALLLAQIPPDSDGQLGGERCTERKKGESSVNSGRKRRPWMSATRPVDPIECVDVGKCPFRTTLILEGLFRWLSIPLGPVKSLACCSWGDGRSQLQPVTSISAF